MKSIIAFSVVESNQDYPMSDRKYRQRGYQDEPGIAREDPRPQGEKRPQERAPGRQLQDPAGPKTPNLMASHEVFRCARCGNGCRCRSRRTAAAPGAASMLHSCINCVSFDTGARWECSQQALTARVSPKDERNPCTFFAPRTTIERQTGHRRVPRARAGVRRSVQITRDPQLENLQFGIRNSSVRIHLENDNRRSALESIGGLNPACEALNAFLIPNCQF